MPKYVLFLLLQSLSLVQADTLGSSQGAMFQGVLKTSCEIIEFGWTKDRSPVDTFIMGVAACIRERNDSDEKVSAVEILSCMKFCFILLDMFIYMLTIQNLSKQFL